MSRPVTVTTAAPTANKVRVRCRAEHPDPRQRGRTCNSVLGDIPGHYHFAGISARRTAEPSDRIQIRCDRSGCKKWNFFLESAQRDGDR